MPSSPPLRILLAGDPAPSDTKTALEASGFQVTITGLGGIDPTEVARSQAVVIAANARVLTTAQSLCRRWRIELGEQYVPIFWLTAADTPPSAGLDAGADVVLPQSTHADHVLAQMRALLRVQQLHGRLASRAAEAQNLNHRLQ